MGLIVNEGVLGERVVYKDEYPCMVMGFQETEIGGFPKIYFLLVNVCTGKIIKAEMDSVRFLVAKDRCGMDGDYYRRCAEKEVLRKRLGPKIANILIDAGYPSMKSVGKNYSKLKDIKGIGAGSLETISQQLEVWKEDKGGISHETEENI